MSEEQSKDERDDGLDEYVDVGLSKFDRVDPVIQVDQEEEEDIYRQDREFLRDLEDRVLERVLEYKKKSASARHSGLRPLMVSLLSLIHKASRIASRMHKKFYGLTLYECQKAMKMCNVSNHTVKDNLRKLVKMGLLEEKLVRIEGEDQERTFYDLRETSDSYPCQDGAYIIFNDSFGSKGLFVLNCPSYPHCSLKKEDCIIDRHLQRLAEVLPAHLKRITNGRVDLGTTGQESREQGESLPWQGSGRGEPDGEPDGEPQGAGWEVRMREPEPPEEPLEGVDRSNGPVPWTELDDRQQKAIDEAIVELRNNGLTYQEVITAVEEEHGVQVKRYNVYEAVKDAGAGSSSDANSGSTPYTELEGYKRSEVDELLRELRSGDEAKTYQECKEEVLERLGVEVSRYNIYEATK